VRGCGPRPRPTASPRGAAPGWRWSQPSGGRWHVSRCGTDRKAPCRLGAGSVCCGRGAGPQRLTLRPPKPRKTAGASAASMTGTSRIARSLAPGAYAARAPLAACLSRLSRVSRRRQPQNGNDHASSASSRGMSSSLANLANIANIDVRRGSLARSECAMRPRIRSWRAGRLISQPRSGVRHPGAGGPHTESESPSPVPFPGAIGDRLRQQPRRAGFPRPLAA
jgi:hypothetical protein